MALKNSDLKKALLDIFEKVAAVEVDCRDAGGEPLPAGEVERRRKEAAEGAMDHFATQLEKAIDDKIKSLDIKITYVSGLTSQTGGSVTALPQQKYEIELS